MLIGLLHLHRTLAYLLFGVALMNVGLTLSRGRTDPRMAGFVGGITRYGIRMGGGLTVLGGLALWAMSPHIPISTTWTWASLVLWVPVELCGSRLLLPEVALALLKPILAELQQTGSTRSSRRPWLGLTSSEQGGRVQIVRVNADSPAQAAGLAPGDLVLAVDGEKVNTLEAFYKKLWAHPQPDAEIQLTVLQGADVRQITIRAVDRLQQMRKPAGI